MESWYFWLASQHSKLLHASQVFQPNPPNQLQPTYALNMRCTFILTLSLLSALETASAASFQAFSGSHCGGAAGKVIGFNGDAGACSGTDNRHSFRITGCNGSMRPSNTQKCKAASHKAIKATDGKCYNVNTGNNWRSALVSCD
jgi:hypothetical protein